MGVLQLGKGFSRTNLPGAAGVFDPDKASDRERIVHGIPRCPVAFGALEQRMRTKLKNFSLIEPRFEPRDQSKTLPNFRPAVVSSNHKQLVRRYHIPAPLARCAEICRGNLSNASRGVSGFFDCQYDK